MPYKYFVPDFINDDMEDEKIKAEFSLEMDPEYPQNYINAILENMEKYKYLVIPSASLVLAVLEYRHITYILCYPIRTAKEEYRKRYLQGGNGEEFIDVFIGGLDYFMKSLQRDVYGTRIMLAEDEYLLEAKEKIDRMIQSS